MQAAFQLCGIRPSSRPIVLALHHGARARETTDAREAFVMQRVVGNFVDDHVSPDILFSPVCKRTDFYKVEFGIPLHDVDRRPVRGLISSYRAKPGFVSCKGYFQRFDFPNRATYVWIFVVDGSSKTSFHLLDRLLRPHELDLARTADGGNSLLGKVVHVNPAGSVVKVRVVAEDFGLMLNIDISPEKYRQLGLRVGEAVHVSPKTAKMFEPDYAI